MVNPNSKLSDGSLAMILEQKNDRLTPIIQILGTKTMSNDRVRAVISDGKDMCQHCILISEDLDQLHNDGKLSKFTVVRLDQYTISSLPKKENMPVILVNKMTILKSGEEINHKLDQGEPFEEGASGPMDVSIDTGLSNTGINTALTSSSFNRPPSSVASAKKPPSKSSAALSSGTLKSENVCPLNVLTPFFNAWVIRVRVTNKTPLKTYHNKNGEGKLFNFDCCDESGEIRITAFNNECDKFYDLIERDKVYLVAKGSVKSANKKFSSLNNDYEITLNSGSVIELCAVDGDEASIPKIRFKFINLSDLINTEAGTIVDVIGVIRAISAAETLISKKTSKELIKKEVTIVDKSLAEARITLWNEVAENFEGQIGQIMALKGTIVGDYRGKTLSTVGSTLISIEPDVPETSLLRNWYNTQGSMANFTSLSKAGDGTAVANNYRYISEINPKLVTGTTGQTYSSFNGTVQATNRSNNHLYKACGQNGCQKKVTDDNDGLYRCSKCDRSGPTFEWRLMLSLQVSDPTGSIWLTVFQDNGEKLLGKSTQELAYLYESDQNEYMNVINLIRFKDYYFRIGSRLDEYNNEVRVRSSAYTVAPNVAVDRAKRLFTIIDTLSAQLN